MGRKPKIIPHILGTMDSIVESFFAKDRAYIMAKKKEEQDRKQTEKPRDKRDKNSK